MADAMPATMREMHEQYLDRKQAYLATRDDTLSAWIADRPGTRPPQFWDFEAWGCELLDQEPGQPQMIHNMGWEDESCEAADQTALDYLIDKRLLTPSERQAAFDARERFFAVLLKARQVLLALPMDAWCSCESSRKVFLTLLLMDAACCMAVEVADSVVRKIERADFWEEWEAKAKASAKEFAAALFGQPKRIDVVPQIRRYVPPGASLAPNGDWFLPVQQFGRRAFA
jgi:hypothetical protein